MDHRLRCEWRRQGVLYLQRDVINHGIEQSGIHYTLDTIKFSTP
jgi:hypothetical protein